MARSPSLPQACLHRVPDPLLELALARKFSCVPPWCALLSVSLLATLAQPSVAPSSVRRGACSCARRPPDHLQTPAVELSRLSPTLSRVFQLGALLFCLPFAGRAHLPLLGRPRCCSLHVRNSLRAAAFSSPVASVVVKHVSKKSQESGEDGTNNMVFTKCTTGSSSQDLSAFVRVLGRV
jgi:hypothetical protein